MKGLVLGDEIESEMMRSLEVVLEMVVEVDNGK